MPGPSGEMQYMNVKTLNEWDPRVSILEFLLVFLYLSHVTRNLSSGFPTRFGINQAVQSQKMARG